MRTIQSIREVDWLNLVLPGSEVKGWRGPLLTAVAATCPKCLILANVFCFLSPWGRSGCIKLLQCQLNLAKSPSFSFVPIIASKFPKQSNAYPKGFTDYGSKGYIKGHRNFLEITSRNLRHTDRHF